MKLEDYSPLKRRIFETAIGLFAGKSFETVTMTDIADELERTKPALYNYFSSKQEILDDMYRYFTVHFFDMRKPMEELKPIFETGTVMEMILSLIFDFRPDIKGLMINILAVVHQRMYYDAKAKRIAKELMIDEGIRYVTDAFDYAIQIGRLAPFDTRWIATVLNDTRNGVYMRVTLEDRHFYTPHIQEMERLTYEHAASLITDLRPSRGADYALDQAASR